MLYGGLTTLLLAASYVLEIFAQPGIFWNLLIEPKCLFVDDNEFCWQRDRLAVAKFSKSRASDKVDDAY